MNGCVMVLNTNLFDVRKRGRDIRGFDSMFTGSDRSSDLRRWVGILLEISDEIIPKFIFEQALCNSDQISSTPSLQVAVREVIYGCLNSFVLKDKVLPCSLDSATLYSLVKDLGVFLKWYFKDENHSQLMEGLSEAIAIKLSNPLVNEFNLQKLVTVLDRKCEVSELGKLCEYSDLFPWKSHPFGHFEKREFYVTLDKEIVWCVVFSVGERKGILECPLTHSLSSAEEIYQLYRILGSPSDSNLVPRNVPKHLLLSAFLEHSDSDVLLSTLNIGKVGECSAYLPYDSISELLNERFLESGWEVKMSTFVWNVCRNDR